MGRNHGVGIRGVRWSSHDRKSKGYLSLIIDIINLESRKSWLEIQGVM